MGFLPKAPAGESTDDLRGIAAQLTEQRPTLEEDGMERVLRRVRPARADKRLRRTRIAVTLSLVLGFCFSGAGAGLAISGIGDGSTSAARQYAPPTEGSGTLGTPATPTVAPPAAETPQGGTAGQEESGAPTPGTGSDEPSGGSTEESGSGAPATSSPAGSAPSAAPVQAARQLSTDSGDTLPFTGWAALPVVALGLLLLGAGLLLRRRTA